MIPIGGSLLSKNIRLPDVEVGGRSSVGLFLANHSVASIPFRLDGHNHCLQIEPGAGVLQPGVVIQVGVTYRSDPDQSAGEVKCLQIASVIGGCRKTDVPIRVRAGRIRMMTVSPGQMHVDLSNVKNHYTQGGKRFLKPHGLSLRVKNVGDISTALTKIEGEGITFADSFNTSREIKPNEERNLEFDVALGSLVNSKRGFTLQFGSFRLECALKTKIDGPKLAFERATKNHGLKRIQKFEIGVITGQLTEDIRFSVANRGNKTLRYRLVDAITMSDGTVKVQATLGERRTTSKSTPSRELKKKCSDEWRLRAEEINAGPLGIIVTFEAENQPTLAPDGEVLPTCRVSLLFSGYVNLTDSAPELHKIECSTLHESGFGMHPTAFVRLVTDQSKTVEARALGMPLVTCCVAYSPKLSMILDEQPKDELAENILALDPSVIEAVLGGTAVGPVTATLATAIKSAMATSDYASAVILAGAALHEFSAYLPERSMLFDLAMKLLQDTSYEAGLDTCERFLSLDACRPHPKGNACYVGTPTLPCWTRFRELVEPRTPFSTSRKDLSSAAVHVLSIESNAALRLKPFLAGLRNLTRTGLSGTAVWAPLAADVHEHLDEEEQALLDVCAERIVGTSKWIEFISSLALKQIDPTCAPALQRILKGEADTDTVLQIATSISGASGGSSSGSRGILCNTLQGLTELRSSPGTPWLYTYAFLRACGGGLANVTRILDFELHKVTPALDTLVCTLQFLTYQRTDLTNAMEPVVLFLQKARDPVTRLGEFIDNPLLETAEPEVVVEIAVDLLALTKHDRIDDIVKEAARFLHRFANNAEVEIIRRRQNSLLHLLHKLVKPGTGSTESVCSAVANLALLTSPKHKSFAKWIKDVGSSTFLGDYSVTVGAGILRELTSVREIGRQQKWVHRLVDVVDKMEIFRRGGHDMDCGKDILTEILLLAQELQPQPELQDSLNRIAVWVKFCGGDESPEERLHAYIVKGGLPAPKLEDLHNSACEFNANAHPLNAGIDCLHHMQKLYRTLMGESSWSGHVVSHAIPLMHAVYVLENITPDDIQYQTMFASFLAVISLLQLENDDVLCVNASAAVCRVEMLPQPPSNEEHRPFPPVPPTKTEEKSCKHHHDQDHPIDHRGESSTSLVGPSSRSSRDVGPNADGSQNDRLGFGAAEGAGSGSACGGQNMMGGGVDSPKKGAATNPVSGAQGRTISVRTALGPSPDPTEKRVDTSSAAADVQADQGNDRGRGSPPLRRGVSGSSRNPSSGSARSESTRYGQNAVSTDPPEGREEPVFHPGNRSD